MNKHSGNLSPAHWKKIAAIAILVLAFGYIYGRPHLERMFGVQLPSITGEDDQRAENDDAKSGRSRNDSSVASGTYDAKLPADFDKSRKSTETCNYCAPSI